MGKGGANPYPGWWATSEEPVWQDVPGCRTRQNSPYDRETLKEKERRERDEYYREKSWSQRNKERKEQFKSDFMNDKYFNQNNHNENAESCHFDNTCDDIDPIFKIKKSSSKEDFKKEYRKLILKHHPDKGGDSSFFIKIQEAYENIKNYFAS
tara:strand:+ start:239 stop:697 length:459 start_codon:yes stop_codon:yes gene_type:complete